MQEMWVQSLCWEDPMEKEMATHSGILAWKSLGQRSLLSYSPWDHRESTGLSMCAHTHTVNETRMSQACHKLIAWKNHSHTIINLLITMAISLYLFMGNISTPPKQNQTATNPRTLSERFSHHEGGPPHTPCSLMPLFHTEPYLTTFGGGDTLSIFSTCRLAAFPLLHCLRLWKGLMPFLSLWLLLCHLQAVSLCCVQLFASL